jgi:16S rRNA (cytidine1402-2'-O)-methyltransferase
MGTLYLIATPIGNLEDISTRALRLLGQVRLIAAEDTRHTRKLLSHYNIHTPITSYYEHNKLEKLNRVLEELEQGDIALVSDAGTPGLSDPGYELVRAVLANGYQVSPVPGPSAPVAALVASGLPTDAFLYLGYLPRKTSERRTLLQKIAPLPYTLIFLEAPHRLLGALEDLADSLGDRQVAVARELTKLHEEIFHGSLLEARQHFEDQGPRGEFTLVIASSNPQTVVWSEEQVVAELEKGLFAGLPTSHLAGEVSARSGWPRRELYQLVLNLQEQRKD